MQHVVIDPWPSNPQPCFFLCSNPQRGFQSESPCLSYCFRLSIAIKAWMYRFFSLKAKAQMRHLEQCNAVQATPGDVSTDQKWLAGFMYWQPSKDSRSNHYAHPLPWMPILDLSSAKVLTFRMYSSGSLVQLHSRVSFARSSPGSMYQYALLLICSASNFQLMA